MIATARDKQSQQQQLETAVSDLQDGARRLPSLTFGELAELIDECADNVLDVSRSWVAAACEAKNIAPDQPVAAEEILGGPASFLRYMRLLAHSLRQSQSCGQPILPRKPRINSIGRTCAPILPAKSFFDKLVFLGMRAEVWLRPEAELKTNASTNTPTSVSESERENLEHTASSPGLVAGVLGAGNVSSIPATDSLYKIFHDRQSVLLKLNPVNDYLEPIFKQIFSPLVSGGFLRIIRGDAEIGKAMVEHPEIGTIHITGSHLTHDKIVWGATEEERDQRRRADSPRISKPITSELGNVSPWIFVPGDYSPKQLEAQAQHVAASIANNASFNCLATKMLVTSRSWTQREQFLNRIEEILDSIPTRYAYYPGAAERFEAATGSPPSIKDGRLPWTLIRDTNPESQPQLFKEESFVCVCAETNLESNDPVGFLDAAAKFANEQLFGTLCASITVPNEFRKHKTRELETAIDSLRYGSVCINQWSGLAYGTMTPPWGGHPTATLKNPQSGIGHVHNTFGVQNFDKSVLWGPLKNWPKPVWFATHRRAHLAGWALTELYDKPSLFRLPKLFYHALLG